MKKTEGITFELRFTLHKGQKFFGPGVADLLTLVREKGSLNAAAAEMSMAYSKAWKIIKQAESALDFPLLATQTGGRHGGGARLTQEGEDFLSRYLAMQSALSATAKKLFVEYF